MKTLIVFACLVGAVFSAAINDNESGVGDGNSDNGEHLFTNITKSTDDETVVELRNEKGELLGETDIFLHEGFQIDKPADRNVCLIKSSSDNSTCFEEKPVGTRIPDEIWDHCEGREVHLLSPISCDVKTEENGSLDESSPNRLRVKRGFYCYWRTERTTCCVETKTCCWWIFCKSCGCKRREGCTISVLECGFRLG